MKPYFEMWAFESIVHAVKHPKGLGQRFATKQNSCPKTIEEFSFLREEKEERTTQTRTETSTNNHLKTTGGELFWVT